MGSCEATVGGQKLHQARPSDTKCTNETPNGGVRACKCKLWWHKLVSTPCLHCTMQCPWTCAMPGSIQQGVGDQSGIDLVISIVTHRPTFRTWCHQRSWSWAYHHYVGKSRLCWVKACPAICRLKKHSTCNNNPIHLHHSKKLQSDMCLDVKCSQASHQQVKQACNLIFLHALLVTPVLSCLPLFSHTRHTCILLGTISLYCLY